ncbi:DUF4844 domain-containing protein [Hymenobacter rubidus]|uniref:DUF4844 domain-containing protein n=1 Tax=Hymenobacter rubidus TaxID=1441626 RepID=UPI00191E53A5|nr:DUF4844 domain-containing protein [Hymenobacter rubidus]
MRTFLLSLFALGVMSAHAQDVVTPVKLPEKAALKLEKMLKQTQAVVVLGRKGSTLPAEARPVLNKILAQSASEFLTISSRRPTKEAYFKSVDAGLAKLSPQLPQLEDRQQVAEYYQDLLDIVGLESSEGRLTAFVETAPPAKGAAGVPTPATAKE